MHTESKHKKTEGKTLDSLNARIILKWTVDVNPSVDACDFYSEVPHSNLSPDTDYTK